MKKVFLLLFALLTISAFQLNAQDQNLCYPDCSHQLFQPAQQTTTTIGNCTLTITYWYRLATCKPPVKADVCITNIEFSGDCIGYYSERELLDAAALHIIAENYMGWYKPTNSGDCDDRWRISHQSCWGYHPTGNPPRLVPCFGIGVIECCYTKYRICINDVGDEVVTIIEELSPQSDCEVTDPPNCTKTCGD